jgi:hypothetical protein
VPCAYDLAAVARRSLDAAGHAFDVSDGVPRPTTAAPNPPNPPDQIPLPLPGQVIELLPATRRAITLRLGHRTITIEHSGNHVYLDLRGGAPLCLSRAEVGRLCAALDRR